MFLASFIFSLGYAGENNFRIKNKKRKINDPMSEALFGGKLADDIDFSSKDLIEKVQETKSLVVFVSSSIDESLLDEFLKKEKPCFLFVITPSISEVLRKKIEKQCDTIYVLESETLPFEKVDMLYFLETHEMISGIGILSDADYIFMSCQKSPQGGVELLSFIKEELENQSLKAGTDFGIQAFLNKVIEVEKKAIENEKFEQEVKDLVFDYLAQARDFSNAEEERKVTRCYYKFKKISDETDNPSFKEILNNAMNLSLTHLRKYSEAQKKQQQAPKGTLPPNENRQNSTGKQNQAPSPHESNVHLRVAAASSNSPNQNSQPIVISDEQQSNGQNVVERGPGHSYPQNSLPSSGGKSNISTIGRIIAPPPPQYLASTPNLFIPQLPNQTVKSPSNCSRQDLTKERTPNAQVNKNNTAQCSFDYEGTFLGFTQNGKFAVIEPGDETIRILSVETGKELRVLQGFTQKITSVEFSPSGSTIAVLDGNAVEVWNIITGKKLCTLDHRGKVRVATFSPNEEVIATVSAGKVRAFNAKNGKELLEISCKGLIASFIARIAFSPNKDELVVSHGLTVTVLDIKSKKIARELKHTKQVEDFCFSDRNEIVTIGAYGVKIWAENNISNPLVEFDTIKFSSTRETVVTISNRGNTTKVWDIRTGKLLCRLEQDQKQITIAELLSNMKKIITASDDGTIEFWDAESNRRLHCQKLDGVIERIQFSADEKKIMVATSTAITVVEL